MKKTLDEWIPKILAAQEEDGYLQTVFTLRDWPHWSDRHRADHEGYVAGYYLEAAVSHYMLTGGKDLRLYNSAKKLADCWTQQHRPGRGPTGMVRRAPSHGNGPGAFRSLRQHGRGQKEG